MTVERQKTRWMCRRGMLELDYLLLNFFDRYYDQLSSEQRKTFSDLLALTDVELYQWLTQKEAPSSEFKALVGKILRISATATAK